MSEQLMVCKALGAMIRKHGEPTEEEINFVAHAAMELGLTAEQNEQVQQVLREGGDYQSFIAEISSRPMRNYLFRRVVAATLIDDKIEEHELATIHQTAKTFDFAEGVVDEYLKWMKEGIAWEKRGVELLARL